MNWIKCSERMPTPGVKVLAFVQKEREGRNPWTSRIRATYAAPKTLEQADEADGGEYDEATDTYWCAEGWYENNEYDEINWMVLDPVTHWMPLPDPPTE